MKEQLSAFFSVAGIQPTANLAIAVSGGADSMALLLVAHAWAQENNSSVTALTVDHGLRAESAREAKTVAGMMRERGIAHHILTPAHTPAGNNTMQAARQWRYDALADYCSQNAITHCLLGHHQGDQLETVALAHLRGRDTLDLSIERSAGEAGMRAQRDYRGVQFLRPLLAVEKNTLTDYLSARNVAWIEDPTNADSQYARTRVRQQLADDPTLKAELLETLATRSAARDARDASLAEAEPRCITMNALGHPSLNLTVWKTLEPELRSLLLANLVRRVGGKPHRPRRHETLRLAEALCNEATGKRTLGHCVIHWKKGAARITSEQRAGD
jgi:tRNA(Ile)-lysidine synthase